jgi:hypothetical protein
LAEASVILRGYKMGRYLGQNISSLEAEERFNIAARWGATAFASAAYLYGTGATGAQSENKWYPSYGVGVHFLLKSEARMVATLEYAHGDAGDCGIYLRLGCAYPVRAPRRRGTGPRVRHEEHWQLCTPPVISSPKRTIPPRT